MEHWRKVFDKRIYDLDYELLVQNQESETRKVINYLELNWDERCLLPHENKNTVATGSSVQVREKVYKGSSKQWLKYEPFLNGAFDSLLQKRKIKTISNFYYGQFYPKKLTCHLPLVRLIMFFT